jgi:hypothetical protein
MRPINFFVVIFAIALASLFALAGPAPASSATTQAHVFTFRNVSPTNMMYSLGLLTLDDYLAGKSTLIWNAAKNDRVVPKGIKLAVPYEPDRALIIYGEAAPIDDLAAGIADFDVAPQQVQIKAEAFRLTAAQAKDLGLEPIVAPTSTLKPEQLENVKAAIRASKVQMLASPVISTFNSMPATIEISGEAGQSTLCVLPKINSDKSITLSMIFTIVEKGPDLPGGIPQSREQRLTTSRRLSDGESAVVGGFSRAGGDTELVMVTASIIH